MRIKSRLSVVRSYEKTTHYRLVSRCLCGIIVWLLFAPWCQRVSYSADWFLAKHLWTFTYYTDLAERWHIHFTQRCAWSLQMIDSTHVRIDLVTSNGTQSTTYPFSTSGGELTLLFEGIPAVLKFQRAPESVIAPLGSWQNADGQRWTFQKDGTFISHTEVRGLYKMLDSDHIRISSVTRKGIKSRSTY